MYLAIDIGGTKTLLAVFNENGKLVFEHKTPTDKAYPKFIKSIDNVLKTELKDYDFSYACCAAPGNIDRQLGVVERLGNLSWRDIPLKDDLEKLLDGVPVLIENDAKLAGLGEAVLVQKKYKKVLYITLSTGIGLGLIVNDIIDTNVGDAGGKGVLLEHDGKLMEWEEFASGRALFARYGKRAAEIDDSKIWQEYSADVALGLYQFIAAFDPDAVIVGGGVGSHFEKFAAPLREELAKLQHNNMVKIPPVIKAQRPEEAVIYGCYELIRQQG